MISVQFSQAARAGALTAAELTGVVPIVLQTSSRNLVVAHLRGLSADDRYSRFGAHLSESALQSYVAKINFEQDICMGILETESQMSGMIHLSVHGHVAELAASISIPYRGSGRGRLLFQAALQRAFQHGIKEVHLATGHPAARRICRGLGCSIYPGQAYPQAYVSLPSGGPLIDTLY